MATQTVRPSPVPSHTWRPLAGDYLCRFILCGYLALEAFQGRRIPVRSEGLLQESQEDGHHHAGLQGFSQTQEEY